MITVTVVQDNSGLLKSCDVRGHAEAGKRGNDIVCAAVSVLTRTAQAVLSKKEGITIRSETPHRGVFTLEIVTQNSEKRDFLAAVGTFLVEGLHSVAIEYPENCVMTTMKERRN